MLKVRTIMYNYLKYLVLILTLGGITIDSQARELTLAEITNSYYKSYTYEKSGNISDAIKAIQLIYNQYPKTYTVNIRLAYLYSLNKKYKNAEAHYKSATAILPSALTPKLGLINVYILSSQYELASKIGYQIIKLDHYNYYGNLKLAYILRVIGKYELSEKILLKMLLLYPSDASFLSELGYLRFNQNKWSEAKTIMRNVKIIDPENIAAQKVLLAIEK